MRVVMVTPYARERDGLADYSAALIGELEGLGHEVSVVLPTRGTGDLALYPHLPAVPTAKAIRSLVGGFDRPDLLHIQFAVSAFHTHLPALLRVLEAAEINNIPVVATLHEVARDLDMLGPAGAALYRKIIRRCEKLLVHTESARERLLELAAEPARVEVLPHFQRTSLPCSEVTATELRDRFGIAPDDTIVLSFGFIHVDKGLDTLVDAWLRLRSRRPELTNTGRLVVAGDVRHRTGPFRAFELRDHAHLRSVMKRVTDADAARDIVFAGHVPEDEIATWFGTSSVAALPYRAIEQSGVANLARAAGLPLAVSNVGDLPLLATPDLTFEPSDVDGLTIVLERCLTEPPAKITTEADDSTGASLAATGLRLAASYQRTLDERGRVAFEQDLRSSRASLSVVICCYNGAEKLPRALHALTHQVGISVEALEVIVVDDGSTDDTSTVAVANGVTVIRHAHNRGAAAARNTGMVAASAEFIGFLDDDCEPGADWAVSLLQSWKAVDDDVVIIGGPLEPIVADTVVGRFTRRHDPLKPLEIELASSADIVYRLKLYIRRLRSTDSPQDLRRVFSVASANLSARRSSSIAMHGFDERFRWGSEDVEFCRRIADNQPLSPIVFDPQVRARHHFVSTLKDTVRRAYSYGRGAARLTRARADVPPTIFPAPVATIMLLAAARRFPWAILGAIAVAPATYGINLTAASSRSDNTRWADPFLTLIQESAANFGFIRGWHTHSLMVRSVQSRTLPNSSGLVRG